MEYNEEIMGWANNGDGEAMCRIAISCRSCGNREEAHEWTEKAADTGWSPAMLQAARDFSTGNGTQKNMEQALFWCKKAAAAGETDAMQMLLELGAKEETDDAIDFLLSILENSVTNIYETHPLVRIQSLGTRRMDEFTPQYEAALERRRLLNMARKLKEGDGLHEK